MNKTFTAKIIHLARWITGQILHKEHVRIWTGLKWQKINLVTGTKNTLMKSRGFLGQLGEHKLKFVT